jgi:hypothetical protein
MLENSLLPSSGTEPRFPGCLAHILITSLTRYSFKCAQTSTSKNIWCMHTVSHIRYGVTDITRHVHNTSGPQTVTFVLNQHFNFSSAAGSNLIRATCPADHVCGPPTQHVDRCNRVEMAVREWLPVHMHDLYQRRNKKKMVPGWEKWP